MPKPTGNLLKRLGPAVKPFERFNKNNKTVPIKKVLRGEKDSFDTQIYNATDDGLPADAKTVSKNDLKALARYLWIIDKGGLFIIFEQTPNLKADRRIVCHTNITKGRKALQGGELWFVGEKEVVLNYKSGRYGADSTLHEEAVIEYFKLVGYKVSLQ